MQPLRKLSQNKVFWIVFSIICIYFVILRHLDVTHLLFTEDDTRQFSRPEDFEGFDNWSGSKDFIVPNVIHFVRFGKFDFTFVDAVIALAAIKNQKPIAIYYHTDQANFFGRHWNAVLSTAVDKVVIKFNYIPAPDIGYPRDIIKLKILMEFGGIFLDDSYIVRNLDEFRRFEMTVGWQIGATFSKTAFIAHKNARFLRKWLSYFTSFRSKHYDDILVQNPKLVHRVRYRFAETSGISSNIFTDKSPGWLDHYVIHLEVGRAVNIDESDIKSHNTAFRDMADKVYPYNWTKEHTSLGER